MKKAQLNLKKQIIIFTLICIIVSFAASAFNKNAYAATTQSGKKIAAASLNEKGGTTGGELGDQTGNEVRFSNYYEFKETYRYKADDSSNETQKVRNTISAMACNGVNNDNIGYGQDYRRGCYDAVSNADGYDLGNINVKVNTDCSAFVGACIKAAGLINKIDVLANYQPVATGSMASELIKAGFSIVTGNVKPGDILLNPNHTAIYVGDAVANTGSSISGGVSSIGHYTTVTQLTLEEIRSITSDDGTIRLDEQNFNYNGEPKDISIVQKKSVLGVISAIKNIVNYILGILISGIRMAVIGFAELFESFINNLLLDIEGTPHTNNQAEYTIEDLLYNRIPALDINIFSDTPGGKALNRDSVLSTIRTLVAGWYYSIRNIAAIVMLIILLYTGLRMAITVSAAEKADCSKQIVTWLKCMVLLFTIHYIIIGILNLNDIVVRLFSTSSSKVGSLHDTIEARAYDVRFTVGLTGAIMYITLMVYWAKFLFLYARRFIYNIIYIVIAPFMITRYALDNANTKGKAGFEKWLNQFVANVLIQPAHALAYSLFMGVAVNLALQSIGGFIIALVFMSQILKMDEYVLGIIRFNGNDASGHLQKMKKPMKEDVPVTIYGNMKIYGTAARDIGTIGKAIVTPAGNYIKYKNYNNPKKIGNIAKLKNKHDEKVIRKTLDKIKANEMTEGEKLRNPELAAEKDGKIEKDKRKVELRKAKINARNGDKSSKKMLKLRKKNRKQIFTASAGAIVDALGTTLGATMAIPLAVAESPEAGIAAFQLIKSPSDQIDKYNKISKKQGEMDKEENKIEKTINLVNQGNDLMNEVEDDYIEDIKGDLRKVNKLNANSVNLEKMLKDEKQKSYARTDGETKEQQSRYKDNIMLQDSIKNILDKIDVSNILSETQKMQIAKNESERIRKDNKLKENATIKDIGNDENIKKIAYHFSETIVKDVVSEGNVEIANKLNQIKDINDKIKETNNGDKKAQINLNRFIENLGNKGKDKYK